MCMIRTITHILDNNFFILSWMWLLCARFDCRIKNEWALFNGMNVRLSFRFLCFRSFGSPHTRHNSSCILTYNPLDSRPHPSYMCQCSWHLRKATTMRAKLSRSLEWSYARRLDCTTFWSFGFWWTVSWLPTKRSIAPKKPATGLVKEFYQHCNCDSKKHSRLLFLPCHSVWERHTVLRRLSFQPHDIDFRPCARGRTSLSVPYTSIRATNR